MNNYFLWIKEAKALIGKLSAAGQPGVCKFAQGNIAGCESPDFNDSGWKPVMGKGAPINGINVDSGAPEKQQETLELCDWSMVDGPAALRKRIMLPQMIEGVPTAQTKVYITMTMLAPVEVFIDGKLSASYKYWGDSRHCEIVVTEHYVPGREHIAVFKTPQNDGDAHLGVYINCGILEEKMLKLSAAVAQLEFLPKLTQDAPIIADECMRELDSLLDVKSMQNRDWVKIEENLSGIDSILEKIDPVAKKFRVHLIAHSHLDMNWLWDYEETVDNCVRDFRMVIALMDENPDLRFSQSQSCVYDIVQKNDPQTFKRVLEKIKEGSWEVTAATWSEHDLYTSGSETFVNQILLAAKYARNVLKTSPSRVCWEPDTFGHPATVPNILTKAGVEFYYHFRCNAGASMKWWEGTDGSRVLDFCFGPYNNAIRPVNIMPVVNEFWDSYGVRTSMFVFGVGDHGGGPTRRDIAVKRVLDKKPGLPLLVFSRVCDFFDEVLEIKKDWPVHRGEQKFIFEGCYTTKTKIKKLLRTGEARLTDVQAVLAVSVANKKADPWLLDAISKAWEKVCFNGFHDISCGCNIKKADAYNFNLGIEAIQTANDALHTCLCASGDAITVFNPLAFERDDVVCMAAPAGIEEAGCLKSEDGQVTGYQVCGGKMFFTAQDVPALGCKQYSMMDQDVKPLVSMPCGGQSGREDGSVYWAHSQRYHIEISSRTGTIVTLYDKKEKKDVLKSLCGFAEVPGAFYAQKSSNLFKMVYEEPHIMSAWVLGNEYAHQFLIGTPSITIVQNGGVFTRFKIERKYNASTFTQFITLYNELDRIEFEIDLDWQEQGHYKTGVPVLKVSFNSGLEKPDYIFETPFGSVERSLQNAELPAYRYIALAEKERAIALLNNNKHGFSVSGPEFAMTLVRGSYSPDASPDLGVVTAKYAVKPYYGVLSKAGMLKDAMAFNSPLTGVNGVVQAGDGLIAVLDENIVITSVKPGCEGNSIVVTAMEAESRDTLAQFNTKLCCKAIFEVDLKQDILKTIPLNGSSFYAVFAGNEIKSFMLQLG